ncbi:MAG: hypothetical protein DWQ05_05855 [Calditrichaeota bacterium]|nr:MAG: hypothetical protein DWQ05_05855 [Calditrichota bacterium]
MQLKDYNFNTIIAFVLFLLILISSACGTRETAPVEPVAVEEIHAKGWSQESSSQFHGDSFDADSVNINECQLCHGPEFIKPCLPCHTVEDRLPSCLECHIDKTPGLGNDPKTHIANFLKNVNGEWHSGIASICYECHTNSQNNDIGFCLYCHGAKWNETH